MTKLQNFALITASVIFSTTAFAGDGGSCTYAEGEKVCAEKTVNVVNVANKTESCSTKMDVVNVANKSESCDKPCDSKMEVKNVANKSESCSTKMDVVNVANKSESCDKSCDSKMEVKNVANKSESCSTKMDVVNVANKSESCDKPCDSKMEVKNVANKSESCSTQKMDVVNTSDKSEACEKSCSEKATEKVVQKSAETVPGIVNIQYADKDLKPETFEIGSKVTDFSATLASTGEAATLSDFAGENATVLIFWNQTCPWCVGSRGAEEAIKDFAADYKEKGVSVVFVDAGINNDVETVKEYAVNNPDIPVFINRDSSMAAAFNAKYTPQSFILDNDMDLVYRGAFYTGSEENRRHHTKNAVEDMLGGGDIVVKEAIGKGCSIKWAEGSRPTT